MSFILPCHVTQRRPLLLSQRIFPRHALHFLVSFFLFTPAVVNLVLVFVWRHAGSGLSLRGRCHWNLDVVWVGMGGQCVPDAPAWGVWLAAAISRLILTAIVLVSLLLTGLLYSLIYGLRRLFILLRQEIIVRYGGHLVIALRTSGRWTLSRYLR